jgi:hypothetical protein
MADRGTAHLRTQFRSFREMGSGPIGVGSPACGLHRGDGRDKLLLLRCMSSPSSRNLCDDAMTRKRPVHGKSCCAIRESGNKDRPSRKALRVYHFREDIPLRCNLFGWSTHKTTDSGITPP